MNEMYGKCEKYLQNLVGKYEGKRASRRVVTVGSVMLKVIFKKCVMVWTGFVWLRGPLASI
jgi:hypothetical protein